MGDKNQAHSTNTKINLLWEAFINSEVNTPERESWLDLFLAHALVQLKNGKTPPEIIALSGSNIGAVLCEEIVRGVEGSCSKEGPCQRGSGQDDLEPLRNHLLSGSGWRAVALLRQLGIHEVGEKLGEEVARVLMCIYGVVAGDPSEAEVEYLGSAGSQAMDQVCRFRLPGRHKSRSASVGSVGSLPSSLSRPKSSLPARNSRVYLPRNPSTSDSDHQPSPPRSLVSSCKLREREPSGFSYFGCGVGRGSDGGEDVQKASNGWAKRRKGRIYPEDMADPSTSNVLGMSCSGGQLAGAVLSLLQALCRTEVTPTATTQVVIFCLEALCSLQFGSLTRSKLQAQATRLLLVALDKLLLNPEATASVLQKGALPMMLRLLEDSISKAQVSVDPTLQQDFIYGVTYAVVNFIHSLVIQCPCPDKMGFATPFQQFLDSYNSRLIESAVSSILAFKGLDEKVSLNRAKKIIGLVGQLVNSLKQARTRFVHMKGCRKARHKVCRVSSIIHHHDDVLGDVFKQTVMPGANREGCKITAISMILSRFVTDAIDRELALRAMQAMMDCGTCCCFPAQGLITRILRLVQVGDSRTRNTGLMLLERTIYKEVGALEEKHCNICCDSAAISKHRWAGLQAFQDMLLSRNTRVAYTVSSHLMRVAPRCATVVQRELLFSVFYPAFLASKKRYFESKGDRDKFTLLTSLSAFTNLLGRMRFACEFLERDGLRHIMDLTRYRDFERLSCTILEIVTIVRLWKLEEVFPSPLLTSENIPELEHIMSLIVNATTHFLTSLKKWQGLENQVVTFKSVTAISKYSGCLEELNTYWASCLTLCLYSPQVRSHCTRHLGIHAYTLLTLFLQHIAKPISVSDLDDSGDLNDRLLSINQLHLELLESLITITTLCPYSGNPGGLKCLKSKLERVAEGKLGLRPVCDVLLRGSGANPTDRLMLPLYPMPKLSNLDVSLAAGLLEDGNSDSTLDSSEDEGYDGDIELTNRKTQEKESVSNKGSLPPSRKISALGERRYYNIVHPSLCHLALDLIVHCHNMEGLRKECVYCLHKLSSAVRDSGHNAVCLVQSGLSLALLKSFSHLLSNRSHQLIELQQAVLELFGYLAKYCLQAEELATFLQFFVADAPPVDLLLGVLQKLMKGCSVQPKHVLSFPAEYSNSDLVNSTQAHKMAITLHHQHLSLGFVSCWSRGGLFLPLNCDLSWAMWVQGFSLCLWLRLHNPLSSLDSHTNHSSGSSSGSVSGQSSMDGVDLSQILHIVSIGYETLVLEFWADAIRDILHVRLTRSDSGRIEVLSEASLEGRISCGVWHHLAISVKDSVHSGKVIIEVTIVVDGWCEMQVPLAFKGLLIRKSRPTCIILGDTEHAPSPLTVSPDGSLRDEGKEKSGGWELGGLVMLRRPVVGKREAEYLRGIGPEACIVTCRPGLLPPYAANLATLPPGTQPTMLPLQAQHNILKTIQENLLMSFNAKDPHIMNIYPHVSGGVGGGFRVVVGGEGCEATRSSQQVPMSLPLVALTTTTPQVHTDVTTAIDLLGGPQLVLFLFARVVELESSEREQAAALGLFLKMATSHDGHTREEALALIPLVARVIDTPLCTPGLVLLQVVVECCCSGELLTEPELLVALVLESPTPWANSHALESLLQTLLSLLKDDHPYREFNASQLNRANALHALLNLCKERLLEGLSVSVELCRGVVEVVRGLMTAPPLLDHIAALSHYLILSHPAHLTFISHSRQSLHFLLPPHPPVNSHQYTRKTGLFGTDLRSYRSLFGKPINASKLNKALTKLKNSKMRRRRGSSLESYRGEDVVADSGITASSLKGNTTDSDQFNHLEGDEWSSASANTYFTSNANNFDLGSETSPETQESSAITSDNEDDVPNIPHNRGWRRGSIGNGEVELVVGLLEVVRDQLLVLPDSVALSPTLMASIVSPHVLITMANHSNHHIVSAVVKVLAAYWERVNSEERSRFVSERLFYLLAMQLPHSLTDLGGMEMVEGLAGIVTGYHRSQLSHQVMQLNHDLGSGCSSTLTLAALPALLALVPASVSHVPTAHNLVSFIHSLFIKVSDWKMMLDYGLTEVLLKSLVKSVHEQDEALSSELSAPEKNVLFADVNSLLATITAHALHSPGSQFAQIVNDVLLEVEYITNMEKGNCGLVSQCFGLLRKAHAAVLQAALTSLTEAIASFSSKSSFLSSVMSVNSEDVETQSHSSASSCTTSHSGKLSRSDLNERYKLVISRATEYFIYFEPDEGNDGGEFIKEVWGSLVQALVTVIERKSMHTRSTYSNVVWTNRDTLRNLSSQMFLWMISPSQPRKLKVYAIQSILSEPRCKDILSYIISTTLVEESVALYLWELGRSCRAGALESERKACEEMSLRLEELCSPGVLGLVSSGPLHDYSSHVWSAQELATRTRASWLAHRTELINKVVYRYEDLAKEMSELAMTVTREVVSLQSVERKKLMEKVKAGFGSRVHATIMWRRLVSDLTHERATFHFPHLYPKSWELDPTEGPHRVRIRMRRCQMDIEPRFFKPDFQENRARSDAGPLNYLLEDWRVPLSAVVVERLHSNTKVRHMCQASVITPQCQTQGELLISRSALYFVPSHHDHSQIGGGGCDTVSQEWSIDQIKEIHRRRFELQERALEIFLQNGRTFLLALNSTKERDEVMEYMSEGELGCRVASEPLCDAVELWRDGQLTNWQYLMILNTLAGRTYNDLMQYPIFPFVLSDYTSPQLDLNDPNSYRNFKKPMAIQDKKNEQHYVKHYNYLKCELAKKGSSSNLMSHPQEPYHYSSHYSNSVTVLHFLVRLPPYTSMFLKYQDNSFDWPDRTFHSLHTTWRLTSSESTTDVKELIPEFFFLPEFLTNREGFEFGLRQSGDAVDQVVLPPWAPDPRLFILVHRQAIESEYARENIPHWIDLVFGYKQVGKAAVDCINVFHPATYYGFDPERVSDPLSRLASYTMVRTYGQTPKQLFKATPHPFPVQNMEAKQTPSNPPPVIPGVKGLSWGEYVGSPGDRGAPRVAWQHQAPVLNLVPLLTNDVFGLPPSACLLLAYTRELPLSLSHQPATCVHGAAVVSWGHGDGVVRAKVRKDQPPVPIIPPSSDSVTICTSTPDSNQIWLCFSSGKIVVYSYKFEGGGGKLEVSEDGRRLVGHKKAVLALYLSRGFSLAASVSQDGTAILWDINTLTYIRSLPDIHIPINVVTISETLGDIATVGQDDSGSLVRAHTVNGQLVGSVATSCRVTATCYSSAPEGTSVNILATATSTGEILLWSSWDLTAVGKITAPGLSQPITSITYSHDSQLLYATSSTGMVIVWQGASKPNSKVPKFLNLTSLL